MRGGRDFAVLKLAGKIGARIEDHLAGKASSDGIVMGTVVTAGNGEPPANHWHVVMLRVTSDGEGGRFYHFRQVDIDYPTAEAAAEVVADLYERQWGRQADAARRRTVQYYATNPGISTEPPRKPDETGDLLTVLPCSASGEACVEAANTSGEDKVAMRKALGIW